MPAKHSLRSPSPGPSQFFLTFGAVLLAMLTAWVVVRAVGPTPVNQQPKVVLPSMPQVPMGWSGVSVGPPPSSAPALAPTAASATPGVTGTSATPTSSPPAPPPPAPPPSRPSSPTSPPRTNPPVPPKTTKPTPAPTRTTPPPPPARDNLSVVIDIYSSWEQGYTTGARLTNNGDRTASWTVRISHSGQQNLDLVNYWNAGGRQSGDTFIFTGTLAPGATVWWGWQAGKTGRGNAHPDGCTLVGGKCTMR